MRTRRCFNYKERSYIIYNYPKKKNIAINSKSLDDKKRRWGKE